MNDSRQKEANVCCLPLQEILSQNRKYTLCIQTKKKMEVQKGKNMSVFTVLHSLNFKHTSLYHEHLSVVTRWMQAEVVLLYVT